MASKNPEVKKAGVKKPEEFVTVGQFRSLEESMAKMIDMVSGLATKTQTPAETVQKKEVEKAAPNKYSVNPEWEDIAREIIGAAVERTEVEYVKGGGQRFTVIIKEEFSNAPKDYLERHKADRRSREISGEGEEGVRAWCKLIKQNLNKK